MDVKRLTMAHLQQFSDVNHHTIEALHDKSFLIPFSDDEISNIFSHQSKDVVYGVFSGESLIAMSGIYFDISDFGEIIEMMDLDIDLDNAAEIGGCMTMPEFRGHGYMFKLNEMLLLHARELKVKHILATAHPENIGSIKSLVKSGMRLVREFDRHGYKRNLYLLDL